LGWNVAEAWSKNFEEQLNSATRSIFKLLAQFNAQTFQLMDESKLGWLMDRSQMGSHKLDSALLLCQQW